jgi:hypothetical protein
MLPFPSIAAVLVFTTIATTTFAQAPTRAPIRSLGSTIAKAPAIFDTLINVRGLSDGRVVVNDVIAYRLVVLDSSFTNVVVWADTTGATKNNYGAEPAVILPVAGDSSVILEARSNSFVMIDPHGNFGRVFALPKSSDRDAVMMSSIYGGAGIDPMGRLVYIGRPGPLDVPIPGCGATKPTLTADSVPLVRASFESRVIDTIARLRFSLIAAEVVPNSNRSDCWAWKLKADVLPLHGDQWVVLSDGTVAIIREQDYRVDWIGPDGSVVSSPKMPFDWRPITAEEKQRMIDSVARIQDSVAASRPVHPDAPPDYKFPSRPVVGPTEIPDYYPPTRLGSMKVDFEGNLWVPPTTSRDARGGLLYDVVNRKGEVIERVQLPAGRVIASFVPGGKVVLRASEGKKVTLELARVR